jgi:hypothetical protein
MENDKIKRGAEGMGEGRKLPQEGTKRCGRALGNEKQ